MYYAVFDYEYEKQPKPGNEFTDSIHKKYFMKNAKLYLVGIKHLCFSEWIFFKWIVYALG